MVQQVGVKYYIEKNGRASTTQAEFENAGPSSMCSNHALLNFGCKVLTSVAKTHTTVQNIPRRGD